MIEQIIEYLNTNSGAMTFLITAVYVVATIFICWANIKSAKATKAQVAEQQREFEEMNRAFVTVTFEIIRSGLAVLRIQNHGKRIATNVSVHISDDFVENMADKRDKETVQKLCQSAFTVGIGQSWYICIGSHLQLERMSKELLTVTVSYHDSVSNYCETTSIDLKQYFWSLIYDSPIEDMRKELKDNTKELKSIGKSIDIMAKAQQEEREQNHA